MHIRPAPLGDAPRLTALAHAAKRTWGYPEAWIATWADALIVSRDTLATAHVAVAEDEAEIVGFYALERFGRAVHLEHCWVRPDRMRTGVGRALVQHALATATRSGAEVVVVESDPNAEGFYRRLGAVVAGTVAAPVPGAPRRTLPVLHLAVARRPTSR